MRSSLAGVFTKRTSRLSPDIPHHYYITSSQKVDGKMISELKYCVYSDAYKRAYELGQEHKMPFIVTKAPKL